MKPHSNTVKLQSKPLCFKTIPFSPSKKLLKILTHFSPQSGGLSQLPSIIIFFCKNISCCRAMRHFRQLC